MTQKRAFLVLGPESSGTHMVTDLLISAGCAGHSGEHIDWQANKIELDSNEEAPWQSDLPTDQQPWDVSLPEDEQLIVWRFSFPHAGRWPNLGETISHLRRKKYQVQAVVVVRDQYATLRSQLKWRHSVDFQTAEQSIQGALLRIFSQLSDNDISFSVTTFESLVNYPGAPNLLLEQLELPAPEGDQSIDLQDANLKWYTAIDPKRDSAFNERGFPCAIENTQKYYQRVSLGKSRMRDQRLIICGLAHNIISELPDFIARMEALGGLFRDYKLVLFENGSRDGTKSVLARWMKDNDKVTVFSNPIPRPAWSHLRSPERMRYMAQCRNQYLDYVSDKGEPSDVVVVADTDLPLGFSYEGIAHSFGHDDWDMMGSNGLLILPVKGNTSGSRIYYDAWAHREHHDEKTIDIERFNSIRLNRGDPLMRVNSCFGGLAIYSYAAFTCGARYAGDSCEHVQFHRQIREAGFDRFYLNPSQIALYS